MQINGLGSGATAVNAIAAKAANTDFAAKLESATKQLPADKDDQKLRATCKEMESVFLNYMLTQMRSTVPKVTLMGDNSKTDIFQSMLDGELSKNMAQAGGIGIADMIYRQLSQNQNGRP